MDSLEKTPHGNRVDEDDYGKTPEYMGSGGSRSIAKMKEDVAKQGMVGIISHAT